MGKSSLIGTIAIDLVAYTGKLLAPLKRAQAAISSVGSSAAKVGMFVGGIAAPVAAAVGGLLTVGTAVSRVVKAFGEIDDLAKESDRLGIPTEKLIGLQHAASMAGVDADTLGKSLQFMLKSGGDLSDLDGIANTLAGIADPAERMQYAVSKFGKGGAGMINMLAGGSEGLQQMQEDAEKLGLTLSRTDAAKVEAAGDAFSRIGLMIDGVARKIAVELAPFITWLANGMVDIGTKGDGMGGLVRTAIDGIIGAIAMLANAAQSTMKWIAEGWVAIAKPVELVTEGFVSGFSWAFATMQTYVTEFISFCISAFAQFATWIDSILPESMQTGVGAMATDFAKNYEQVAEEQRKAMEAKSWKVDLDFTSSAMDLAEGLGGDKWGDRIERKVAEIRADADAAAAAAIPAFGGDEEDVATVKGDLSTAALERGSAAAMSAITATQKSMTLDQQNLEAQKRHTGLLDRIERNTRTGLAPAGIA